MCPTCATNRKTRCLRESGTSTYVWDSVSDSAEDIGDAGVCEMDGIGVCPYPSCNESPKVVSTICGGGGRSSSGTPSAASQGSRSKCEIGERLGVREPDCRLCLWRWYEYGVRGLSKRERDADAASRWSEETTRLNSSAPTREKEGMWPGGGDEGERERVRGRLGTSVWMPSVGGLGWEIARARS